MDTPLEVEPEGALVVPWMGPPWLGPPGVVTALDWGASAVVLPEAPFLLP